MAQFARSGNTLVPGSSTSLGGNGQDYAQSVAVDILGNAYVTGITSSSDLTDHNGAPIALNVIFQTFEDISRCL